MSVEWRSEQNGECMLGLTEMMLTKSDVCRSSFMDVYSATDPMRWELYGDALLAMPGAKGACSQAASKLAHDNE